MAILTCSSAGGCGRHAVLTERLLQAEAVKQSHIVARAAKHRIGKACKLLDLLMNFAAWYTGIRNHPVFVRFGKDTLHFRISLRPVNWVRQAALDQRQAATGLVVISVHAMTNNAGDAFARGRMALQIGDERVFAQV